jgi:hypothetical protein
MNPVPFLIKRAKVDVARMLAEARVREASDRLREAEILEQELENVRDYYDVSKGSPTARGIGGGLLGGGTGAILGGLAGLLMGRPGLGAGIGGGIGALGGGYLGATSPRRARETLEDWDKGDTMVTLPTRLPSSTAVITSDIDPGILEERPVSPEARMVLRKLLRAPRE